PPRTRAPRGGRRSHGRDGGGRSPYRWRRRWDARSPAKSARRSRNVPLGWRARLRPARLEEQARPLSDPRSGGASPMKKARRSRIANRGRLEQARPTLLGKQARPLADDHVVPLPVDVLRDEPERPRGEDHHVFGENERSARQRHADSRGTGEDQRVARTAHEEAPEQRGQEEPGARTPGQGQHGGEQRGEQPRSRIGEDLRNEGAETKPAAHLTPAQVAIEERPHGTLGAHGDEQVRR